MLLAEKVHVRFALWNDDENINRRAHLMPTKTLTEDYNSCEDLCYGCKGSCKTTP